MTNLDFGIGWEEVPFKEATLRDGREVLTYRDTEGKYHYWLRQPEYADWTILRLPGDVDVAPNYYLKTPWEWCIRTGRGTWDRIPDGWTPPDGCEVLSGGTR